MNNWLCMKCVQNPLRPTLLTELFACLDSSESAMASTP